MNIFKKTIDNLMNAILSREKESSDNRLKNFFAASLRSIIMTYSKFVNSEDPEMKELEASIVTFSRAAIKIFENKEFCSNFGNYSQFQQEISQIVEANNKIFSGLKKYSFFDEIDNSFSFSLSTIKALEDEGKKAMIVEKELIKNNSNLLKKITNEISWMYWLNNHKTDISISLSELVKPLSEFLQFAFDFEPEQKLLLYLDANFSHGGNFNIEYIDAFLGNFTNVSLFNKIKSKSLNLAIGGDKKVRTKPPKSIRLEIVYIPDQDATSMPNGYFKVGDYLALSNQEAKPIYNFSNKRVVNPTIIESDTIIRFGRDRKERPPVNIWFHEKQQLVSHKQCSIDFDERSFGLTCISAVNPTLFKLNPKTPIPLFEDACIQFSDTEVLRVTKIEIGKRDGTLKKNLNKVVLFQKMPVVPLCQIQEIVIGTQKKKIIHNSKAKEYPDLPPGVVARIIVELLPFYRKDASLPRTYEFNIIENQNKTFQYFRIENGLPLKEPFPAITIGRKNRAIEIPVDSISSEHCEITLGTDDKFYLSEKKPSTNGSFMFLKTFSQHENSEFSDRYELVEGMAFSIDGIVFEVKEALPQVPKF